MRLIAPTTLCTRDLSSAALELYLARVCAVEAVLVRIFLCGTASAGRGGGLGGVLGEIDGQLDEYLDLVRGHQRRRVSASGCQRRGDWMEAIFIEIIYLFPEEILDFPRPESEATASCVLS